MGMKITNKLPAMKGDYQLNHYGETESSFHWKDVEKEFSWHTTGKINIAYEAIDRHVETFRKNKVALYFDDGVRKESYSFYTMKKFSNKAANVLKQYSSLRKGDRLFIFLPRSPELYFVLLGAIKMGLIVGPLFESFMKEAIYDRLVDSEAKVLVTTASLLKRVPLEKLPKLEKIFIVGGGIEEGSQLINFDKRFHEATDSFEIEWMDLEDGMLLHYNFETSDLKGILHVHHGMIQLYQTTKWVLDLGEKDIYWCTADPGWIIGTAYGVFGPWLNGVTTLIIGGSFSPRNWYKAIEQYGVTVWYSTPTVFRMLMNAGSSILSDYDLSTLRHIVSVGEPLKSDVIRWGLDELRYRIHDTWGITETGGPIISNYPSMDIKIGSMGKPIPGIDVAIIDEKGRELPPNMIGKLVIRQGSPSMMRQIWDNSEQYNHYFVNEWFDSGAFAFKDEEGYFWYQGNGHDVQLTSKERFNPIEIENKLLEHRAIVDAGVIEKPDPIFGEVFKAFITLRDGLQRNEEMMQEIQRFLQSHFAANVVLKEIEFKKKLPKTKSGKIMRHVLKAWV